MGEVMRAVSPTLTLPLKGAGDSRLFTPSPVEGEGWGGGSANSVPQC
jgi:hypothetical protein